MGQGLKIKIVIHVDTAHHYDLPPRFVQGRGDSLFPVDLRRPEEGPLRLTLFHLRDQPAAQPGAEGTVRDPEGGKMGKDRLDLLLPQGDQGQVPGNPNVQAGQPAVCLLGGRRIRADQGGGRPPAGQLGQTGVQVLKDQSFI